MKDYQHTSLSSILLKYRETFHSVVPFEKGKDKFVALDLSAANKQLTEEIYADTTRFSHFVSAQIKSADANYAIGGYDELRVVYSRSDVFNSGTSADEPRRRHLGTDIWANAGTPVFAPFKGRIHSSAFNNSYGDYGATIILAHELDGLKFHTLYGHLSEADLKYSTGALIKGGQQFCSFGQPHENGNWPPHLHFQLIIDIGDYQGDYPGVCAEKHRQYYLQNCPDPELVLNFDRRIR